MPVSKNRRKNGKKANPAALAIKRQNQIKKLASEIETKIKDATCLLSLDLDLDKETIANFFPANDWDFIPCIGADGLDDPTALTFELKDFCLEHYFCGSLAVCFLRAETEQAWEGVIELEYEESPECYFPIKSLVDIEAIKAHALFFAKVLKEFDAVVEDRCGKFFEKECTEESLT